MRTVKLKSADLSLHHERLRIFNEELERAFYHIGKRLVMHELNSRANATATVTEPIVSRLFDLISESVSTLAQHHQPTEQRTRLSPLAREAVAVLEDHIYNRVGPEGLSLAEASDLLQRTLGHFSNPTVLQAMLQRTTDSHRLAVRRKRVMRNGAFLIEMLEQRFEQQRQQDTQRVVEKLTQQQRVG